MGGCALAVVQLTTSTQVLARLEIKSAKKTNEIYNDLIYLS